MSDLKINNSTPKSIRLGSLYASKIYQGSTLVWPPIGSPWLEEVTTGFDYSGVFRINDLTPVEQALEVRVTLVEENFSNNGVTKVTWNSVNMFQVNDYGTITGTTGAGTQIHFPTFNLVDYSNGDTCKLRCEIISLASDILPIPPYIDIILSIPSPP